MNICLEIFIRYIGIGLIYAIVDLCVAGVIGVLEDFCYRKHPFAYVEYRKETYRKSAELMEDLKKMTIKNWASIISHYAIFWPKTIFDDAWEHYVKIMSIRTNWN